MDCKLIQHTIVGKIWSLKPLSVKDLVFGTRIVPNYSAYRLEVGTVYYLLLNVCTHVYLTKFPTPPISPSTLGQSGVLAFVAYLQYCDTDSVTSRILYCNTSPEEFDKNIFVSMLDVYVLRVSLHYLIPADNNQQVAYTCKSASVHSSRSSVAFLLRTSSTYQSTRSKNQLKS